MNFPGFALNYFMLATPLLVAYGLAVRAARFSPKLLSMVWTWANLAVVVWLVYRGVTLNPPRPGRRLHACCPTSHQADAEPHPPQFASRTL